MPQMYAKLVLVIGNRTKDISPISASENKIYVGNKTRKYLNVTRDFICCQTPKIKKKLLPLFIFNVKKK